ncbi:hypothetical protein QEM27_002712 [Pseudomonas putida]|uniref:hypothetical protein n=1 Tax=Pseudomonas putida TaxID=303 RepID=UPI000CD3BE5D|nr:hypothetical protein [Pseudomonas putida]EKT4494982.1 hypothetical protein [Pseudomonas putida]EKT8866913.1 hypothetical protein [Pseudomonas putida]POF97091.1 hypothetical protein BGP81_10270 [Pseudomonas putida]
MAYEVIVEEYVLQCEITHSISVKGDPGSWASPEDFYGYREMEFEIVSGNTYDADGNPVGLGKNDCTAVADKYAEEIEEILWEYLEDKAAAEAEDWHDDLRHSGWEAA